MEPSFLSQANPWKGKAWRDPVPRRHDAGMYHSHEAAQRAIRRLARWMAAHPEATSQRAAPHHIVANAGRAMAQYRP